MKKTVMGRRFAAAVLTLVLAIALALPASANSIHTVDIDVVIHGDGSATVTEYWDITMDNSSNTEFYVAKHNLDNMRLEDLAVVELHGDGTETPFETLGSWNLNATRSQKAGKAGLVPTGGGYEVCWGFGELGRHQYRVTYRITDVVKGYEGGDAMNFNFLSDAAGGVGRFDITLAAEDFALEKPATRIWVYGYEAESTFEADGTIFVEGQGTFRQSDYAVILLVFDPGQLSPGDVRSGSVQAVIDRAMEGSIWEQDYGYGGGSSSSGSSGAYTNRYLWIMIAPMILVGLMPIVIVFVVRAAGKSSQKRLGGTAKAYSNVNYSRELPFYGNLPATYARLQDMGGTDEGSIIGCYILEWVRSRQVEIVMQEKGVLKKREEAALRLNDPRPDMPQMDAYLYSMMQSAAGSDGILESKEFEKWARKKYTTVEGWYSSYKSMGNNILDQMGAFSLQPVEYFFGLFKTTRRAITPLGDEMTARMYGFRRYLREFTLINERTPKEVELWDQYLVFAQLFGIADEVASQFKNLYPDFFTAQNQYNHYGYDATDIIIATSISRSFSRAAHSGYRAGVSAASSSSSGGGGGSSSSGGGGGSSGGGGAGGR